PEGDENRMLCRCEQVAETTVRSALRCGIALPTVDAVKRRTRAGMGWCQGEFCRPRTAALLSGLAKADIGPETDAQREGLARVGREELLRYFAAQEAGR
ncbi:MAG: (2Fe-2S)-binding protein, partial [Oscillospiraceae bacterium]